jgi:thymidylate synthase
MGIGKISMKDFDTQYKEIIKESLEEGFLRPTRSGIPAYSLIGKTIVHDMKGGFPLCTLRQMPQKSMRVETEFYLKGYTDKKWLTDRGCHFWDHWQNRLSDDPNDLGPTYGFEWRNFGAEYTGIGDYSNQGVDQIKWVLEKLKKYPENKRLVVSQWNPKDIDQQAIPPCPFAFQLLKHGNDLNIIFYQRSADVCIGLPNDFAQHALLLHLFCLETEYNPGKVIGMFGQVELYENHLEGAKELLTRETFAYPQVITSSFSSIFDWKFEDTIFLDYKHGEKMYFPIAV